MALMERVATLLRANLNDMLDRAEDAEKMLKQLVLDMENQLLQVKTQVAIALADQHLLEKKLREQEEIVSLWHRRAELAVGKRDDALARAALERALNHEAALTAFRAQVEDQAVEAAALRATFMTLQNKLTETRGQCGVLIAQHRHARMLSGATQSQAATDDEGQGAAGHHALNHVQGRMGDRKAQSQAAAAVMPGKTLESRVAQLRRDDRVEQLLADLKSKQRLPATG